MFKLIARGRNTYVKRTGGARALAYRMSYSGGRACQ
jgi:hypothetical protein